MDSRDKTIVVEEDKRIAQTLEGIKKVFTEKKISIPEEIRQVQLRKITAKHPNILKLKESVQNAVELFCQNKTESAMAAIDQLFKAHNLAILQMTDDLQKSHIAFQLEINEQISQMKFQYLEALQNAALCYRKEVRSKNAKMWRVKFQQFQDMFGAVCTVNQSIAPYELDLKRGTPLAFGHALREKNTNLSPQPSLLDFEHFTFGMMIDITNRMIEEALFYKDADALNLLQLNLEKMLKKTSPFFKIVKSGFISHLKKLILIKDDKALLQEMGAKISLKIDAKNKQFVEEVKTETNKLLDYSIHWSSDALTAMDELKNLVCKLMEDFSRLLQLNNKVKESDKRAAIKMREVHEIYVDVLHRAEPCDIPALQTKILISVAELKQSNNALMESCSEMTHIKNNLENGLKNFKNFAAPDVIQKFSDELSHEYKKHEALQVSLASLENERILVSALQQFLPIFPTFAVQNSHLLEDTKAMHAAETCVRENLNCIEFFLKGKKQSAEMHPKDLILATERLIRLMKEKFLSVQEIKILLDEKFNIVKEKLAQATQEMYEPLRELMITIHHQYALAESFHQATDALLGRLADAEKKLLEQEMHAKQLEKKEEVVSEFKKYIHKSVMHNLHIWRTNYLGGVILRSEGVDYRIPHGIAQILMSEVKFSDSEQWMKSVVQTAKYRDALKNTWPYSIFHVRNDNTSIFYHAIIKYLMAEEDALEKFKSSLQKIPRFRG